MQLLKSAIAATTVVLYSRWMGAAGRGELSLLLFYVNLVMIANEYVGGSSLANLVPKYGVRNLNPTAFLWSIFVVIIAFFGFLFMGQSTNIALALSTFSLCLAQLTIHYNYYQGLGRVFQRNYLQLLLELLKLILWIAIAWIAFGPYNCSELINTNTAIYIFLISTFLVWMFSEYLLRKEIGWVHKNKRVPIVGELFKLGFWAQNGQLIQFLNYRLVLMFIDKKLGLSETGIYSNALLIADTIWIFGNSFGTIAHMRMLQSNNAVFRADITIRYAAVALAGTILACLFLVAVPNAVFVFIFGHDFESLKFTTLWFIPAVVALGLSTVFSHYLHATNQFKKLLFANAMGLCIQVGIGFWLIPIWGLKGACVAADVGFVLILAVVLFYFKKQNPNASLKGVFRFKSIRKIVVNMLG